ncbi:EamA family transporter RarD [Pelistega sp. NLN82]|uniref:EamA family transporter RarD n=1 Tax=Pelistega ratti TaxID=2652177 RepID=A0A6L9Y4B8_9BURK|nr:EamA family transporter RarD [Pelistega ratti]NEN74817.1 EamA family transporter RarD [Pelistega ratti]
MLKGICFSLFSSCLFSYLYYFSTLLLPLSGTDVFGYRVLLTAPFVALAIILFKQQGKFIHHLKRIQKHPLLILIFMINGGIIGFQMWLFLWAPNNGSAISVSIGYLLLPIVMVAAARFIFKEHISPLKFTAVMIAMIGVIITILTKGELSWEASAICIGYTTYFSLRKKLKMMDITAFFIEILLLLPLCLYFIWQTDIQSVQLQNPSIFYLLPILGLISGTALISYILASNYLPINLLGLLGYIEPIIMFWIAILIGETMDSDTYPLFVCLIMAMVLIVVDGIRYARQAKYK